MPITIDVHPLSLATACGGQAEADTKRILAQFTQAIREHVAALDNGGLYATKDGCLVAEITAKMTVRFSVENDRADVEISTHAKLPAPKGRKEPVRLREGEFLVEQEDAEQLTLTRPLRELQARGEKESPR
jgi:hypothetical protein